MAKVRALYRSLRSLSLSYVRYGSVPRGALDFAR